MTKEDFKKITRSNLKYDQERVNLMKENLFKKSMKDNKKTTAWSVRIPNRLDAELLLLMSKFNVNKTVLVEELLTISVEILKQNTKDL